MQNYFQFDRAFNKNILYGKAAIKLGFFLSIFLFQSSYLSAQKQELKHPLRGAVMMANSHVPNQTNAGKLTLIIPTWGFDLDYKLTKKWSLGLQSDIKIQSFTVEENGLNLVRTNPIDISLVAHYYPIHHWSIYAGPGYEIEQHENLILLKLGTEYSFEISEKFEIGLNLIYENKEEIYDTWTFGVAFNWLLVE